MKKEAQNVELIKNDFVCGAKAPVITKITACPMFNYMFLTCDKKPDKTASGIIISTNSGRGSQIEMKQDIIKCGDGVRTLKPGYSVEIDPRPYFVKDWVDQNNPTINEELHKKTVGIAWPIESIDGVDMMVVPDNHIRMYWKNGLE